MTVSAVVVAFGPVPLLERSVEALTRSPEVSEVVVVDNGAAPHRLAEAAGLSPRVTAAGDGKNLGFGGGCNLGAATAAGDLLVFVNPDAVVEPGAVAELVKPLADPDVTITSASVRLLDRPELLNSAGGAIHYTGLGWSTGFEQPAAAFADAADVAAASGAAMAMRKADFDRLGGFTDELFLYHEDAELSLRVWMDGGRVRYVPSAVVLHDYDFARNDRKLHYLERNRLILLLTCFEWRTLALLAPALAVVELGMVLLSVVQGWFGEKAAGYRWLLRHRRWLAARRRDVQRSRALPDGAVSTVLAAAIDPGQINLPFVVKPANVVLGGYWRVVRPLLRGPSL